MQTTSPFINSERSVESAFEINKQNDQSFEQEEVKIEIKPVEKEVKPEVPIEEIKNDE